jgi:MYXO-CTERM domain-containing protein
VSTGDDSSVSTGAEGGVTLAGGGIASIDPHYKATEIDDKTATQITLTGLTNGLNYVVVVSSIDGSGNVGPVSTTTCLQPEPTDDYWKTYKKNNGTTSGCTLDGGTGAPVFAMGIAAAAAALARRRRRP